MSCVLKVTDAAGRSALLTGDIEARQEAELLASAPAALRSDILVVPHHGSRTSSTPAFLAAVSPRVAVIQAGYRNRFGHPHPAVLAGYQAAGIEVVRTDHCGAWRWDDGGAEVHTHGAQTLLACHFARRSALKLVRLLLTLAGRRPE